MLAGERCAFAEGRHICAQVVIPHAVGIFFISFTALEEEYVGFHALCVEDAGGQAQDRVHVAFIHEVLADTLAVAIGEEHVVW